MTNDRLADLAAAGVSTWLDDLSRERLRSGNLKSLITDKHVVGVTTNPTIFAAALANGEAYDEQVRELAKSDASTEDAVRAITVADVQHACGVFHDTWEATGGVAAASRWRSTRGSRGVDVTAVFLALEGDGVDKFEQSWSQLWNTVTEQLGKAG